MDKPAKPDQRQASLEASARHPVRWQDPAFYDEAALDVELRRVFDICHGCRRCFNLCDSFPILFDAIDDSPSGELDSVPSAQFKPVVDACTLCDMCFITKCPYVPPHEFQLDFPHLMLRYRAVEHNKGQSSLIAKEITKTDRNGKLGCASTPLSNWASKTSNSLARNLLEKTLQIDKRAYLPPYATRPLTSSATAVQPAAPTHRVVIYATCFANYNSTAIGEAALDVLARNGVGCELVYPECCGMPQLEHGDIQDVADRAERIAKIMQPHIDHGQQIVSLTPSCSLMIKHEWPLLVPESKLVKKLAAATQDISEYLVNLSRERNISTGLQPLAGGVTVHIACHSRALNLGHKGAELLRLLPDTKVEVIERCSGHGGSWGVMKSNFDVAIRMGKSAAKTAARQANAFLVSECPLAREHIVQGMELLGDTLPRHDFQHPVQLLAHAYALGDSGVNSGVSSSGDSSSDDSSNGKSDGGGDSDDNSNGINADSSSERSDGDATGGRRE